MHLFYMLPAELLVHIIEMLPPEVFVNFALATYPLLLAHGLVPPLCATRIAGLKAGSLRLLDSLPLPPELGLQILGLLEPIDIMRFAIANS